MSSPSSNRGSLGSPGQQTASTPASGRQRGLSSSPLVVSPPTSRTGTHARELSSDSAPIGTDDDPDDDPDHDESDHLEDLETPSQKVRRLVHEMLVQHLAAVRPMRRNAKAKAVAYDRRLRNLEQTNGHAQALGGGGTDEQLSRLLSDLISAMSAVEHEDTKFEELCAQFVQISGSSNETWLFRVGPVHGDVQDVVSATAQGFEVVPTEQDLLPAYFQELNDLRQLLTQAEQDLVHLKNMRNTQARAGVEPALRLISGIARYEVEIDTYKERIRRLKSDTSIFGPAHHLVDSLPRGSDYLEGENDDEDDELGARQEGR